MHKTSADKLREEIKARAAREAARSYLQTNGCGEERQPRAVVTNSVRLPAGQSWQAASSQTKPKGPFAASPVDDLPSGWTKVYDPSSEKFYFWNEASGETSW